MKNRRTKGALCISLAILSLLLGSCADTQGNTGGSGTEQTLAELGVTPIAFGAIGGEGSLAEHEISCRKSLLTKAAAAKEGTVSYRPKAISVQALVDGLGLSPKQTGSGETVTGYANDSCDLDMLSNGTFCLTKKKARSSRSRSPTRNVSGSPKRLCKNTVCCATIWRFPQKSARIKPTVKAGASSSERSCGSVRKPTATGNCSAIPASRCGSVRTVR